MKKIIFLVLFTLTLNVTNAYVDGMTIELKSPEISTNDKTYMSVFLLDENQQQIENAMPVMKATPNFPVDISNFISCSSAEGRELCAKMDNDLVGLAGAYVSEITSKNIDENVMLTVYSDNTDKAKTISRELLIGKGKSEEVETLSEVPKVGADKFIGKGILAILGIMILLFSLFLVFSRKEIKQ